MPSNINYLKWLCKEYIKEYKHIMTYVYTYYEIWAASPYFKYINLFTEDIYNIINETIISYNKGIVIRNKMMKNNLFNNINVINEKINNLKNVKLFIKNNLSNIDNIEQQYLIREYIIDNIVIYYPFDNEPIIRILISNNYLLYKDFYIYYIELINLIISIFYDICFLLLTDYNSSYKTISHKLNKLNVNVKRINKIYLIPNVYNPLSNKEIHMKYDNNINYIGSI